MSNIEAVLFVAAVALAVMALGCTGWRFDTSFVLDGEAVLLGVDGRSDFDGLHSRRHDAEVEFYAFDILVSDGEDVRKLPLSMRKARLARLLAHVSTASSFPISRRARSALTCFATPA